MLKIPAGLFLEKGKQEMGKMWDSLLPTIEGLLAADPYYGKPFFLKVFLKPNPGEHSRKVYAQPCISRPMAILDTGLFKLYPKEERFELLYWLPDQESLGLFQKGKGLYNETVAGWILAYRKGELDKTELSIDVKDLVKTDKGLTLPQRSKEEIQKRLMAFQKRKDSETYTMVT